jgi:endonuclease/exonuclease/phosphatase (EEP) superfamily protein YafD
VLLFIIGLTLAAAGVLATALPLSRSTQWWVRVLDFPRAQILLVLAAALAILLAASAVEGNQGIARGVGIACTLVALAFQAFKMRPYSRLAATQVPGIVEATQASQIRVLIANVLEPNRNSRALLALVERWNPDLVFAVECNQRWVTELDALQGAYPHAVRCPQDNAYGLALYSRLPMESVEIRFLRQPDIPSVKMDLRIGSGRKIRCYGLHPAPPSPQHATETDQRDAELLTVAFEIRELDVPVLVFGDLNDVAWSPTTALFRAVSEMRDPRIGRGQFNTFHANWPWLRYPLDHIFVSHHFSLLRLKRLPHFGSDHFPILAELALNPLGEQPPEDIVEQGPTQGELEEAAERVAQADVLQREAVPTESERA